MSLTNIQGFMNWVSIGIRVFAIVICRYDVFRLLFRVVEHLKVFSSGFIDTYRVRTFCF